jgi:DNA-binding transcriptional LysR family regulator
MSNVQPARRRRSSAWRVLLALALAAQGWACLPECSRTEVLTNPLDGGALGCARSEDCPRPENALVCVDEVDRTTKGCVACVANACVRYKPETCK